MSDRWISAADWEGLVNKVAKRVEPWRGKFLALGGRPVLTNACLLSMPLYCMGLYLMPDDVHAGFDKHRSRFFWEGLGEKPRYHMVRWAGICKSKECGGLSVTNSKLINSSLILKWIWKICAHSPIWKICSHEQGLWADIIRAKYLPDGNFCMATASCGSQF